LSYGKTSFFNVTQGVHSILVVIIDPHHFPRIKKQTNSWLSQYMQKRKTHLIKNEHFCSSAKGKIVHKHIYYGLLLHCTKLQKFLFLLIHEKLLCFLLFYCVCVYVQFLPVIQNSELLSFPVSPLIIMFFMDFVHLI
jgi:hypothetical protein